MKEEQEQEAALTKWTGAAGIASAALVLGGLIAIGSVPAADAPVEEYASHFYDYHDRILAGGSFAALGLALTLCFLVGLSATLRRRQPELATAGLAAGALRIGVLYVGSAFLLAGAYRFGLGEPTQTRTLADLYGIAFVLSAYPSMVSLGAFGIALLRTKEVAPWLGWATVLAAGAHLVGASMFAQSGPLVPTGFVATGLMPAIYYGWVVVISVALLMGTLRPAGKG